MKDIELQRMTCPGELVSRAEACMGFFSPLQTLSQSCQFAYYMPKHLQNLFNLNQNGSFKNRCPSLDHQISFSGLRSVMND